MKSKPVLALSRFEREFETAKYGDVGHDLYVTVVKQTWFEKLVSWFIDSKVMIIWPIIGVRTLVSGIHLSMPNDLWCEVRPRSSTSRRKLEVLGGTIDSGYRGELFTVLHNFGLMPRVIEEGERYAQVVFYPAIRPHIVYTSDEEFTLLVEGEGQDSRGFDGFGSTGR